MQTVTLANHGDLFCIPCGKGFTCLGFDVCIDRTRRLAGWLNLGYLAPRAERGTLDSYAEYETAMSVARSYCDRTGTRCPLDLSPQLIGLEGWRVEVRYSTGGKPRRFIVGRSTGWYPCHLEIAHRNSSGGPAASGPYASVRAIEQVRGS